MSDELLWTFFRTKELKCGHPGCRVVSGSIPLYREDQNMNALDRVAETL